MYPIVLHTVQPPRQQLAGQPRTPCRGTKCHRRDATVPAFSSRPTDTKTGTPLIETQPQRNARPDRTPSTTAKSLLPAYTTGHRELKNIMMRPIQIHGTSEQTARRRIREKAMTASGDPNAGYHKGNRRGCGGLPSSEQRLGWCREPKKEKQTASGEVGEGVHKKQSLVHK